MTKCRHNGKDAYILVLYLTLRMASAWKNSRKDENNG